MKFTDYINENVADFDAARRKRDMHQQQQHKASGFANIENAIAATIDQMVARGMDEFDARDQVYKHLSDIVMANDLDKHS